MSVTLEELFLPLIKEELSRIKDELTSELIEEVKKKVLNETYFTRKEAAGYLKVSITTIDNYCSNGLKKYKLGTSTRLKKEDIDNFVSNLNSFSNKKILEDER